MLLPINTSMHCFREFSHLFVGYNGETISLTCRITNLRGLKSEPFSEYFQILSSRHVRSGRLLLNPVGSGSGLKFSTDAISTLLPVIQLVEKDIPCRYSNRVNFKFQKILKTTKFYDLFLDCLNFNAYS